MKSAGFFIGRQQIASRLGFTVPRFCCNGHIFSKFFTQSCHDFSAVTRFRYQRATQIFFDKIVPRFFLAWRDFAGGQSPARWPQNRATIWNTVVRFDRQRLKNVLFKLRLDFHLWTKSHEEKIVNNFSVAHNFLGSISTSKFSFLKQNNTACLCYAVFENAFYSF